MSADLRAADAGPRGQPGRDRPGADHPRHRPLRPDRRRLRRRKDRAGAASLHSRPHRHPVRRAHPVRRRTPSSTSRWRWSSASGGSCTARAAGLILRAVGDNHASAHALGYPVLQDPAARDPVRRRLRRARAAPICRSSTRRSSPGMTAGRGWIALALVVFASWLPGRLVIGAYLFGAVTILQLHAQGCGRRRSLAIDVGVALSRDRSSSWSLMSRARNRRLDRACGRSGPCSCPTAETCPKRARRGGRASGETVHPSVTRR